MIDDMLVRLFETQTDVVNPKELQGIVIIDELEAHLHPKWQVKFPRLLSETFPNVQFIASTHSALPFLGAPEGAIFLKVKRTKNTGTIVEKIPLEVANLLPNAIYTSQLFGLESIVNSQNRDFSQLHTEDIIMKFNVRQSAKKNCKALSMDYRFYLR